MMKEREQKRQAFMREKEIEMKRQAFKEKSEMVQREHERMQEAR